MAEPGEIWFVSDVHLFHGGDDYLAQFLRFLDQARVAARELYVVGDLFEFWIGDRQAELDFYAPLFARIRELTDAGVRVALIRGNRDFLIGPAFSAAGADLVPDEIVIDLGGRRVHVSHGDQFCIHDRSYQRARVAMRSRPVLGIAKLLPASIGLFLARAYRGISERKKARKKLRTGNRFHTIADGVAAEFERGDWDVVLCGHIHYPRDQRLEVAGRSRRVITTGAWEEGPNYVAFDGRDLVLRRFPGVAAWTATEPAGAGG